MEYGIGVFAGLAILLLEFTIHYGKREAEVLRIEGVVALTDADAYVVLFHFIGADEVIDLGGCQYARQAALVALPVLVDAVDSEEGTRCDERVKAAGLEGEQIFAVFRVGDRSGAVSQPGAAYRVAGRARLAVDTVGLRIIGNVPVEDLAFSLVTPAAIRSSYAAAILVARPFLE